MYMFKLTCRIVGVQTRFVHCMQQFERKRLTHCFNFDIVQRVQIVSLISFMHMRPCFYAVYVVCTYCR
jgi:hypothetical protein